MMNKDGHSYSIKDVAATSATTPAHKHHITPPHHKGQFKRFFKVLFFFVQDIKI
jgi:hypothetical protein